MLRALSLLSISHRRIKGQAYRWAIGPEPEQTAPNWTVSPPTPLLSRLPSHSVRAVVPATPTLNCRAADTASPRRRTSPRMDGPSASAADSLATCAGTVRPSRVFSRRRGDCGVPRPASAFPPPGSPRSRLLLRGSHRFNKFVPCFFFVLFFVQSLCSCTLNACRFVCRRGRVRRTVWCGRPGGRRPGSLW